MGRAELKPRIRVLLGEASSLGPGKAALLEAIAQTGSISAAARVLGMSYRRAWDLVDAMNRGFCTPLVATAAGGRRGGGAALTPLGRQVLARYRTMERKAQTALKADLAAFQRMLRRCS